MWATFHQGTGHPMEYTYCGFIKWDADTDEAPLWALWERWDDGDMFVFADLDMDVVNKTARIRSSYRHGFGWLLPHYEDNYGFVDAEEQDILGKMLANKGYMLETNEAMKVATFNEPASEAEAERWRPFAHGIFGAPPRPEDPHTSHAYELACALFENV